MPFVLKNDSTFTYATFYETKTKVIVRDPVSIMRYGEVERFIDISWTSDFKTINDLLFLMLNTMGKPQMVYNIEKVSISDAPFITGKLVSVLDDTSGLGAGTETTALITGKSIEFNAYDLVSGWAHTFVTCRYLDCMTGLLMSTQRQERI